jgi:hypothetical protein
MPVVVAKAQADIILINVRFKVAVLLQQFIAAIVICSRAAPVAYAVMISIVEKSGQPPISTLHIHLIVHFNTLVLFFFLIPPSAAKQLT